MAREVDAEEKFTKEKKKEKKFESLRNIQIYQITLGRITEDKIFKFHHFKKGKDIPVTGHGIL
jgi:hypothetical protein